MKINTVMKPNSLKKIFLVDDDKTYMRSIEKVLSNSKEHAFIIKKFQTGEECLAQMGETPDVVVLDYCLNSVEENARNGISILKSIKFRSPGTRVVLLSGQKDIEVALEAVYAGADEYLIKNEKAHEKVMRLTSSFFESPGGEAKMQEKHKRFRWRVGVPVLLVLLYVFLNFVL